MMAKHSQRGTDGRFTKSGAPIPDSDGKGDTSALEHVIAPSADPRGEHSAPGYPSFGQSYPTREFTNPDGSYSPLRGRRPVVVNAETGEQLDAHITDVRGVDTRSHFGQTHVVGVEDDGLGGEFSGAKYPDHDGTDTMRGYRRTPGTDGYRLPSMYERDHEAEWRGGR
jgi:hypothetical protein